MSAFEAVPVETVRAYWDARPCNIRHSPRPIGTKEYFDEVEARKYRVEPHIAGFADFARWKGLRVLEIGCGIGTDTINFARAGAEVSAVDLSERSLDIARARAGVFGLSDRIRFFCANAEQLSMHVPITAYDLVYAFGVIHHSPHPGRILAELCRYAKPGGTLKLMVYHRYAWKVASVIMTAGKGKFWQLDRLIAEYSEAQTGCPVSYVYGRNEARHLVESHGFRVIDLHVDHLFPYRISDYVQYRYVKEWYFQRLPPPVFRALERIAGWHLLITAQRG